MHHRHHKLLCGFPSPHVVAAFAVLSGLFASAQGQAVPGDPTPNLEFAVFGDGGQLENRTLTEFEHKVLILYYYAPW